jgi:hypothetical protein
MFLRTWLFKDLLYKLLITIGDTGVERRERWKGTQRTGENPIKFAKIPIKF